jgi:hypothetical protein
MLLVLHAVEDVWRDFGGQEEEDDRRFDEKRIFGAASAKPAL